MCGVVVVAVFLVGGGFFPYVVTLVPSHSHFQ